jgi:hypothetical protein
MSGLADSLVARMVAQRDLLQEMDDRFSSISANVASPDESAPQTAPKESVMSTSQDQTSRLAENLPGFDASPAIANLENGLLGNLSTPTQQTVTELPLQHFNGSPAGLSVNLGGPMTGVDPYHLITPVINALGTLGTGQFSGIDPTQILSGISHAFDGTATPLQQAAGSLASDWQGESGTAANAATQAAVANGTQVANQANGLGNSLSTAASYVAQARQQMINIIDQYQATLAASDLSTPSGKAAALTAANQANTLGSAVMQELQGNLGSQASQVSAIGAPVGVTDSPTAGNTLLSNPINWLLGPTGLPGAFNTVVS